jgi:hypothetical protein
MLYRKLFILAVLLIMTVGVFYMPSLASAQTTCTNPFICFTSSNCCPGFVCGGGRFGLCYKPTQP